MNVYEHFDLLTTHPKNSSSTLKIAEKKQN